MGKFKDKLYKNKYFMLNSVICIFYLEGLGSRGFRGIPGWIMNQSLFFILNILIVFILFMLIKNIFNSTISYLTVNFTLIVLGIINYNKYSMQLSVFLPKDVMMIDELVSIAKGILTKTFLLKIGIYTLLVIIFFWYIIKKSSESILKMNLNYKNIIIFTLIFFLIFTFGHSESYSQSGYLFYFLKDITNIENEIKAPDEISKSNLLKKYLENSTESGEKTDNQITEENEESIKPNIIIVMNEAFWNPKLLKGIEFSNNPIPNFESIAKESVSGYLLAPVFGGTTANSEFQVLTGINSRTHDSSLIMYDGNLKGPMLSLATTLRSQGYNSTAIHPNVNWYYDRMNNYKKLGFDAYYALEYMHNIEYVEYYVSDEYTNEKIIETVASTEEKDFIYAITMQNHGPYSYHRYNNYDVKVTNEKNSEAELILNSYIQGVYEADTSLKNLVDALKEIDEETIVVFFGDHLPYLGKKNLIFDKYGFEADELMSPIQKQNMMYTVPFLIWSNYQTNKSSKDIPLMNMNYLGAKVLEMANLKMPNYYKFLLDMKEKYPVIWDDYALDSNYKVVTDEKTYKEKYDALNLYQYLIFNNELEGKDQEFFTEKNGDYNLKYNQIRVNSVEKDHNTLVLKSDNFYENMKCFINGDEVTYESVNKEEIHVNNFTHNLNEISLELLLIDEKGTTIAEWRYEK